MTRCRGEIGARVEDFNAIKNLERGLPVGGKAAGKQGRASKASQVPASTPPAAHNSTPRDGSNSAANRRRSSTGAELADAHPPTDPNADEGAANKAKRRSSGGAQRDQQQCAGDRDEVCVPAV